MSPTDASNNAALVELEADGAEWDLEELQLLCFPSCLHTALFHCLYPSQSPGRTVYAEIPHHIMYTWSFLRKLLFQKALGLCIADDKSRLLGRNHQIIFLQQLGDVVVCSNCHPHCIVWGFCQQHQRTNRLSKGPCEAVGTSCESS